MDRRVLSLSSLLSVVVACPDSPGVEPTATDASSTAGTSSPEPTTSDASSSEPTTSDASTSDATDLTSDSTTGPVGCVDVADCAGGETACRTPVACERGVCVFEDKAQGTPVSDPAVGDCAVAVCDGAGGLEAIAEPADLPDDGLPCTVDACDGMTPTHTLMAGLPCYSGPEGTAGVGACVAGVQACGRDGTPEGACVGEVVPAAEVCVMDASDDNCDGNLSDLGPCVCGDDLVSDGEECDDGDVDDGDTCSAQCKQQEIVQVAIGSTYACALLSGGRVKCWGYNLIGQLGHGDTVNRGDMPNEMGDKLPYVDLGEGVEAIALTAGGYHTCALISDHRVKCWGGNDRGQLGYGDLGSRGDGPGEMGDDLGFVNLGTDLTVESLQATGAFTCAVFTDGRVKCWGDNGSGQLGLGDKQNRGDAPFEMGNNLPFVDLGPGAKVKSLAQISYGGVVQGSVCALLEGGALKCWGDNTNGQLGLGDVKDRGDAPGEMGANLPEVALGQGLTVKSLVGGGFHLCALLSNDRVKCWGAAGYNGRNIQVSDLGNLPGHMGDALPYVDFGQDGKATHITAGDGHTCVRTTGGDVKCWGNSSGGQLGYGDIEHRGDQPGELGEALPVVDLGVTPVVGLVGGGGMTCARPSTGAIKCWGHNGGGQLGIGSTWDVGAHLLDMGENLVTTKLYSDAW